MINFAESSFSVTVVSGLGCNLFHLISKSLGLAVEDVASAHAIYCNAVELGMGTAVEIGGSRQIGP